MNKTYKDFEKEVIRVKQRYMEDHIKYNNPFKTEESTENGLYVFFIANRLISTIVKFDETYGYLDTANIGYAQLQKLQSLQAGLQESYS
jgi:hypothetical protein